MATNPTEPPWVAEVLDYWFGELGEREWFRHDPALDERIRARFGDLHARLLDSGALEVAGLRASQAAVIVLDQFSRNLFRGQAHAFSGDATARRLALEVIDAGLDKALPAAERLFLYLPFEHSEDCSEQALSVHLHEQLGNEAWTRYALAHQRIVERFGRFPHRNAALGRESTPGELASLADPMGSF